MMEGAPPPTLRPVEAPSWLRCDLLLNAAEGAALSGLNALSTTCTLYVPGLGNDAAALADRPPMPKRSVPLLNALLMAAPPRSAGVYCPGPGPARLSILGSSGGPTLSSGRAKDPVVLARLKSDTMRRAPSYCPGPGPRKYSLGSRGSRRSLLTNPLPYPFLLRLSVRFTISATDPTYVPGPGVSASRLSRRYVRPPNPSGALAFTLMSVSYLEGMLLWLLGAPDR
mmetsp:Transcript_1731/g.3909  ORF Transcript_1731/g.3909 Transcript_1731/m.3909 type:complete len:226 (-) Transcript_1731:374-1051(-)